MITEKMTVDVLRIVIEPGDEPVWIVSPYAPPYRVKVSRVQAHLRHRDGEMIFAEVSGVQYPEGENTPTGFVSHYSIDAATGFPSELRDLVQAQARKF